MITGLKKLLEESAETNQAVVRGCSLLFIVLLLIFTYPSAVSEQENLLERLSPTEKSSSSKKHKRLRDAIKPWQGGSYRAGDWILEKDYYKNWKREPQSLLWLHGPCEYLIPT